MSTRHTRQACQRNDRAGGPRPGCSRSSAPSALLRAVAAASGPAATATALAETVGLNRTTAWRILSTLEQRATGQPRPRDRAVLAGLRSRRPRPAGGRRLLARRRTPCWSGSPPRPARRRRWRSARWRADLRRRGRPRRDRLGQLAGPAGLAARDLDRQGAAGVLRPDQDPGLLTCRAVAGCGASPRPRSPNAPRSRRSSSRPGSGVTPSAAASSRSPPGACPRRCSTRRPPGRGAQHLGPPSGSPPAVRRLGDWRSPAPRSSRVAVAAIACGQTVSPTDRRRIAGRSLVGQVRAGALRVERPLPARSQVEHAPGGSAPRTGCAPAGSRRRPGCRGRPRR